MDFVVQCKAKVIFPSHIAWIAKYKIKSNYLTTKVYEATKITHWLLLMCVCVLVLLQR